MPLNDYKENKLKDLIWENEVLKNAIVKHFLGVNLDNRPSNRIKNIEGEINYEWNINN